MSASKMTLQQYIQSRNYRRRLQSKSKSKNKLLGRTSSPSLKQSLVPSSIIIEQLDVNDKLKYVPQRQIKQLEEEIKQIDNSTEGFSKIHKKAEQIKQFVRQFIADDKIFVDFCKTLIELESLYRLQLIEAYRYQLFKFQFQNQNNKDDKKMKMLKQLNDNYMNSRFEYKKSISKTKVDLTNSQKLIIKQVLETKGHLVDHPKQTNGIEKGLKQPVLQNKMSSFFSKFLPVNKMVQSTQIFSNKETQQNPRSSTQYKIQTSLMQRQTQKQPYSKSPSSKKVVFLNEQSIQQDQKQHTIPDFNLNIGDWKNNHTNQIDQSHVQIVHSNLQSSEGSQVKLSPFDVIKGLCIKQSIISNDKEKRKGKQKQKGKIDQINEKEKKKPNPTKLSDQLYKIGKIK